MGSEGSANVLSTALDKIQCDEKKLGIPLQRFRICSNETYIDDVLLLDARRNVIDHEFSNMCKLLISHLAQKRAWGQVGFVLPEAIASGLGAVRGSNHKATRPNVYEEAIDILMQFLQGKNLLNAEEIKAIDDGERVPPEDLPYSQWNHFATRDQEYCMGKYLGQYYDPMKHTLMTYYFSMLGETS